MSQKQYLLPKRLILPGVYEDLSSFNGGVTIDAGGLAVANKAFYVPFMFPASVTLHALHFFAANGTGNYDLGLYDEDCVSRLASSGSTAMSAIGLKTLTIPDMRIPAGQPLYAALALSSTSGAIWRAVTALIRANLMAGIGQETSALPLPATATPVATDFLGAPLFACSVR